MTIRNRFSSLHQDQVGLPCFWLGVFGPWFEGFDFKIPFSFFSNVSSCDEGVEPCGISRISGVRECEAWVVGKVPSKANGTETVRGKSLPFEAMLGVPRHRDNVRDVCASKRCSANSTRGLLR